MPIVREACYARTQKARGILALQGAYFTMPANTTVYQLPLDSHDIETITALLENMRKYRTRSYSIFARPCPTVPRHGFVDSRVVQTIEEVLALQAETLAQDSLAELVFMATIDAKKSAIVTPSTIAVGLGHDGATQGKNVVTFPLAGVQLQENLHTLANVKNCPYYETVQDADRNVLVVQLRDGVTPPNGVKSGDNWIPREITVSEVIYASGDALEFELAVKNASENAVLYHPAGSFLSHYSQHAMLRNMPIFFSELPEVGQHFDATSEKQSLPETTRFALGFSAGMDAPLISRTATLVPFALTMLHNASALLPDANGAYLLGIACATLLRVSYAAILGEFRHKAKRNGKTRDDVYTATLQGIHAFTKRRFSVRRALHSFLNAHWDSGYGGRKWAECTELTLALEEECINFLRKPAAQGVLNIIGAAHNVVNSAHNNGPFLSKFCSGSVFDYAAHGGFYLTITSFSTAYDLLGELAVPSKPVVIRKYRARKTTTDSGVKTVKQLTEKTLQFSARNGEVFHFQYGVMGAYNSCDLHRENMFECDVAFLRHIIRKTEATFPSLAKTKREYWRLIPEFLSQSLLALLEKNHFGIGK